MPTTSATTDPAPAAPAAPAVAVGSVRPSSVWFSETVRAVVTAARRRGLRPPVFRAPPRLDGVDRTIRRLPDGGAVVAVRVAGRPPAAVRADVVEGVVVANCLGVEQADVFRRVAWGAIEATERPAFPVVVVAPVPGVPGATPPGSPDPGPVVPPPDPPGCRSGTMDGSSVRVA